MIVNQVKAGFGPGIKGGYGVVLAKKADGHWSVLVLISASEASVGLAARRQDRRDDLHPDRRPDAAAPLLPALQYRRRTPRRSPAPRARAPRPTRASSRRLPSSVYGKDAGLYAGATVKAGYIVRDDDDNFTLYNTSYTLPELLYSNWVTPPAEVLPLMHYVQRVAP